jgi:hypothetical protein
MGIGGAILYSSMVMAVRGILQLRAKVMHSLRRVRVRFSVVPRFTVRAPIR